jgi:hypothetical protein
MSIGDVVLFVLLYLLICAYIYFVIQEHKKKKMTLSSLPLYESSPLQWYSSVTETKRYITGKRIIRPLRSKRKRISLRKEIDWERYVHKEFGMMQIGNNVEMIKEQFDPAISTQIQKINSIKEMKDE